MSVRRSLSIPGVAVLGLAVCGCDREASDPPHVVLVMLDTLRADSLGCYGYERDTTPTLDRLAEESVLFERLLATAPSTGPSQMSLFTGTLPAVHGISNGAPGWPSKRLTVLPEVFAAEGYTTVAFADGGILQRDYGFDRGFDQFESVYEPFDRKLAKVRDWFDAPPHGSTFLFLHTYGVHAPYVPLPGHDIFSDPDYDGPIRGALAPLRRAIRDGGASNLTDLQRDFWRAFRVRDFGAADTAYLRDLYDGAIHGVDAQLEGLFELLDRAGWLDRGWLVVTSDHGEAFGEHGTYQHRQVYQEDLHVPLLVRPPGGVDGRRIAGWHSQLDLGASLLDWLGLEVPETMEGRPFGLDGGAPTRPPAFAAEPAGATRVVLDGPFKLIERASGATELYDLEADPLELDARSSDDERRARLLERLADRRRASEVLLERVGPALREGSQQSSERLDELRALGYDG